MRFPIASVIALMFMLLCNHTVAAAGVDKSSCSFRGIKLYGKVRKVDGFPDLKVQWVNSFPDLKVEPVDSFPNACGKWQFVDSFPDFKVQFVDSFPDLKIERVKSFPGIP